METIKYNGQESISLQLPNDIWYLVLRKIIVENILPRSSKDLLTPEVVYKTYVWLKWRTVSRGWRDNIECIFRSVDVVRGFFIGLLSVDRNRPLRRFAKGALSSHYYAKFSHIRDDGHAVFKQAVDWARQDESKKTAMIKEEQIFIKKQIALELEQIGDYWIYFITMEFDATMVPDLRFDLHTPEVSLPWLGFLRYFFLEFALRLRIHRFHGLLFPVNEARYRANHDRNGADGRLEECISQRRFEGDVFQKLVKPMRCAYRGFPSPRDWHGVKKPPTRVGLRSQTRIYEETLHVMEADWLRRLPSDMVLPLDNVVAKLEFPGNVESWLLGEHAGERDIGNSILQAFRHVLTMSWLIPTARIMAFHEMRKPEGEYYLLTRRRFEELGWRPVEEDGEPGISTDDMLAWQQERMRKRKRDDDDRT